MDKDFIKQNRVILGLRRIAHSSDEEVESLIKGALDLGIHYFDIADIYTGGVCEEKLGKVLKANPSLRSKRFIQTKCGIVRNPGDPTVRDLSKKHILEAVDASLRRRNTDHVDCLLLHRPDIFRDNKEIQEAISILKKEGKILHFGVSNRDKEIIGYLQEGGSNQVEVNQLQLSLGQPSLLSQVFNTNNPDQSPLLSDGLFFYRKRKNRPLQCWSPYQYEFFNGSIFTNSHRKPTQALLKQIAEKYHTTPCAIATSFLTRLGDNIEVITGSTDLSHIKETLDGVSIQRTKTEWYGLYCSTGNLLP